MVNPTATTESSSNANSTAGQGGNTASAHSAGGHGASSAAGSKAAPVGDAASMADAIEQMRVAATSVYEAVGALRGASTNAAKGKLDESKSKAKSFEAQAESAITEKPLLYLGAAFAAGWVVSKLMKSS